MAGLMNAEQALNLLAEIDSEMESGSECSEQESSYSESESENSSSEEDGKSSTSTSSSSESEPALSCIALIFLAAYSFVLSVRYCYR